VFKDGAIEALQELGPAIYTTPELKSPSQIEKIGSRAKELVKEWAYMPAVGLTVAPITDKRQAVKVQTTAEAFGAALKTILPEVQT